ncbi:unnamed protein product [Prorocentrum cordatum]|uniref:MYND-type domain-containing protein n=1 Tax=Prorocentrum cordatum TaxID=2364126 RepID=A0ABN9UGT4_9DINO|nr:unnamed protein product [Polarella glacialis]
MQAYTVFDDGYGVGFLCAAANTCYCARHGFGFHPLVLSREDDMEVLCEGRHFAWAKVALLRWLLAERGDAWLEGSAGARLLESRLGPAAREEAARAQWVAWLDADLMVVDHGKSLHDFADDGKDLVVGEDMADLDWLNTGLLLCRAGSAWARGLWGRVWCEGDQAFHLGEFWDQSGPRRKETDHICVVDTGGFQTNNPRFAQFAFHAAGMKDKMRCCSFLVEVGAIRGLHVQSSPKASCGVGDKARWRVCFDKLRAAEHAAGNPFGWPCEARRAWRNERPVARVSATDPGNWSAPAVLSSPPPAPWTLTALPGACCAEVTVDIADRAPVFADDAPPDGRPLSFSSRARLWEMVDYAAGYPPSRHAVARGRRRPGGNAAAAAVLLEPGCPAAAAQAGEAAGTRAAGHSAYDPWADPAAEVRSVVVRGGEALLVPGGWWLSTRCLRPCLSVVVPLGPQRAAGGEAPWGASRHAAAALVERLQRKEGGAAIKQVLAEGRPGPAPEPGRPPRFNAVCHLEVYRGGGAELERSTRRGGGGPHAFFVGADRALGPLEAVLRGMAVHERALVAVRGAGAGAGGGPLAGDAVFDVELLAVCTPPPRRGPPLAPYEAAWGTWFGPPEGWRPLPLSGASAAASRWSGGGPCARCSAAAAPLRCARCRRAWYCCGHCQRDDWPLHRTSCTGGPQKERRGGESFG